MSSSTDTTPTQIYTLSLHDALPICNPQNMLIGSFSGIGYRDFGAALAPVALAGLVMVVVIIALVYRGEFRRTAARVEIEPPPVDRKSTRLNSSHANISYAVFCLKKK